MATLKTIIAAYLIATFIICPASLSMAQGDYTTAAATEDWTKDVDKKIDTTIKVLTAIKSEMKDVKKEDLPSLPAGGITAESADEVAETARKTSSLISKLIRAWNRVRKTADPEAKDTITAEQFDQQKDQWAKSISTKLDKTIAAMQVMREELDKIEADDSKDETSN